VSEPNELEVPTWKCPACGARWASAVVTNCVAHVAGRLCSVPGERQPQVVRRARVARVSLDLFHTDSRLREEPLLLVERMSRGELECVRDAVLAEIQRRRAPEPEHHEDLRQLRRILREMHPPARCTVQDLIDWCDGDLGRAAAARGESADG
jgi:hypothetical protein